MIGQTVSHYTILEKLGSGGMGTVYKAEDTKLHRPVALKFLHTDLSHLDEAKLRFINEAIAASALDHNNICNIHEIDETGDNQIFICMAYYDGRSLKDLISAGHLPTEKSNDYALQIANGLHRAHEAGIIHRDIKPANIMITDEDIVKIVDFGLAKLRGHSDLTKTGSTPGTVAYMSPERLEGKDVDERSDIWSYGVLLYEMVTGILPFRADYDQAVMYSILTSKLDTRTLEKTNAPLVLKQVIKKCLQKNPSRRYQSFQEILDTFSQTPTRDSQPVSPRDNRYPVFDWIREHKNIAVLSGIFILVFISIFLYWKMWGTAPERVSVIIAEFENFTNESVFDNSLTKGLQISLKQSEYLDIFPGYKINQALRRMELSETLNLDRNLTLAIAERENIPIVISGNIAKLGNLYVLTGNIIEVSSREIIKQQQVSVREIEKILEGMDHLVKRIRKDLGESTRLINQTSLPLAKVTTPSLEALEFYTQGMEFAKLGKYEEAIEVEEKAVALDSTFAMAIHSLSYNYEKVGNHRKAIYYHNKVLPLIDRVTEKEKYSMLYMYYGPTFERDYEKAYYYAEKLVKEYPDDGVGVANLAHLAMFAGDYNKALEYNRRAMAIDSVYKGTCFNNMAYTYGLMGNATEALRYFKRSKMIRPDYMDIDFYIAQIFWITGELDSTEYIFRSNIMKADNAYRMRIYSYLTCLYYYRGMLDQAENYARMGIEVCKLEKKPADEAYFNYMLSELARCQSLKKELNSHSKRAVDLSQSPFWEISLTAIACAKSKNIDRAENLAELLQTIDEPDPLFQKRRIDVMNFIKAIGEVNKGLTDQALLRFQQIKKQYSGDPLYWLSRKEEGKIRLMAGDSSGIKIYREILDHRGEIILASLGGIRRSGFWSSRLIPELMLETAEHCLQTGDTLQAVQLMKEAENIWQQADEDYLRIKELKELVQKIDD